MMQTIYKVFAIIFVVFGTINLYALDYSESFMSEDNAKFAFSIVASLIGLMLTFVLNTWSKLKLKTQK